MGGRSSASAAWPLSPESPASSAGQLLLPDAGGPSLDAFVGNHAPQGGLLNASRLNTAVSGGVEESDMTDGGAISIPHGY